MYTALDSILDMLATCSAPKYKNVFPPTTLYNESWMLRLVLNWFSSAKLKTGVHPLCIPEGEQWYSEAILQTQFKARTRKLKDKLAESHTHADGVIGHFQIGRTGEGDLCLPENSKSFIVLEAKMFSPLSLGTTNAPNFHQAARTIACMANTLSLDPPHNASEFERIGFYLIVPKKRENNRKFHEQMDIGKIRDKIRDRVDDYRNEAEYIDKQNWFNDYLVPMINKIANDKTIGILSWDDIIDFIKTKDPDAATKIEEFYENCKRFN